MDTTNAALHVLSRAEQLARTAGHPQLADDLYGLGCALGSNENRDGWADLIIMSYSESAERWSVSARASGDSEWVTHEGSAEELDTLMSLARDVATGG